MPYVETGAHLDANQLLAEALVDAVAGSTGGSEPPRGGESTFRAGDGALAPLLPSTLVDG